jgi:tetratricopeptide (TPR) repeat protein
MFYRALQLEGDHALAYANMAESLIDRSLFDRAVYCLREAAALDPGLSRVHARLAQAYAETGRYERARQLFLRELRGNPGDIDTLLDLGCLLVRMNRLAEAGEKFRRVLELDPDYADAHYYLADLAQRQHRAKDAMVGFRLVMRLAPAYPEVRRRLARLLLDENEIGAARRLLRAELLEIRRSGSMMLPDELDELGRLMLDARLPREGGALFEALVEKRPDDAGVWHHLGLCLLQTGDSVRGVEACRRAVRLEPNHVSALHNLALAHLREGRWGRARLYVRRAVTAAPDDPALRRLRLAVGVHGLGAIGRAAVRLSRLR